MFGYLVYAEGRGEHPDLRQFDASSYHVIQSYKELRAMNPDDMRYYDGILVVPSENRTGGIVGTLLKDLIPKDCIERTVVVFPHKVTSQMRPFRKNITPTFPSPTKLEEHLSELGS